MTTVNNFDDILAILDSNPDYQEALRQRVLDEEHRRLPERIDRAVKSVDDLAQTVAEFVRRTNETLANHEARLERVEGQIADLNTTTERVLATVADIQQRLASVETKVDALADVPERLTNVETAMDAMTGRMDTMTGRMDTMQGQMDTMTGQMDTMTGQMDTMQGQLNNLTGTDYERRIVRRSRGIVQRHLGIRQVQLLQAISVPDNTAVPNLLNDAMESGAISHEQADDVDDADIILFGNASDGLDFYVVAEVSITIDDHDVDRAYRRAALLSAASGTQARAAVIGTRISNANRDRANSLDVAVVIASAQEQE